MKRIRQAARILLRDPDGRILLFRFHYIEGPLAGTGYWGVPGGGVEEGESIAEAAIRELREETGIVIQDVGPVVATDSYDFRLCDGEEVAARDSYFLVDLDRRPTLSRDGYTPEESANLVEHRWWSVEELAATEENIVPSTLAKTLIIIINNE